MPETVVDLFCPDCGKFLCTVTDSPLIEGKDFFCVDCALTRMETENRRDTLVALRNEDVVFDIMRTNKGVCTYTP